MTSTTMHLLIAIGSFLVVIAVALLGVWQFGSGLDQKGLVAARNPRTDAERERHRPMAVLDRVLRRTNFGAYVHRRILASGVNVRVSTFLVLLTVVVLVVVLLAWRYLAPFFGIASIGVVAWAFFQFLRRMEDRRREEFIGQLPELARVLSNAFSAGLALRTAIDMAADELDEPARGELRRTADALKLGQATEDALEDLGQRLPSRELSVLVSTLVISARAGGSMVTALRNISTTLEQRKEVRREVRTVLSQSMATGYVVAGLGIGELFLINAIVPNGLRTLTSNPLGLVLVIVSGLLFIAGLVTINRMSKVDT